MLKSRRKTRKAKLEWKILAMLACFSVSAGLWENFRQLWLQDNGYSASDVSTLTSVGMFLSVAGVILVGFKLRMKYLKGFMTLVLGIKLIALLVLSGFNKSGSTGIINALTVVDILTSYLIVASVYPLLTTVIKNNQTYSKRKLVEYWARDLGVLIGGIMISKALFGAKIDYNECLLVSTIFLVVAVAIMFSFKVRVISSEPKRHDSTVKYIMRSKIQVCYMLYAFLAAMSFAAALGLKMLLLTNYLDFSAETATDYLLIVGLLSDVVGVLALKYFTPKNDYLTITLKFGLRLLAYAITVLANDPFITMLAITWSLLISTAYEDVTDGNYINLVDNRHQLSYSTVKHVMSYSGEAVGVLICGAMYDYGVPFIFGSAACLMVVQLGVACYLISLRQRRRRVRHSASRMRYSERMLDE